MSGCLFIVSAPSGAGKTTLVSGLIASDPLVRKSVSYTTRKPRPGEENGRDYHFVTDERFQRMRADGEFLETALVHGNLYGTSKRAVQIECAAGHDVLLEIDWQGALQIKRLFPNAVLIFILPPSYEELAQRLNRRGEDGSEVIVQRLVNARHEVAQARHFDFVIINALFETALFDLKAIVHSQRLKYAAQLRAKSAVFAALGLN